jgi:hypothetical protein
MLLQVLTVWRFWRRDVPGAFPVADAGLLCCFFLASRLLLFRLAVSQVISARGLALPRHCRSISLCPPARSEVTEAAWATRDSRTELGIDTICARPSLVGVGGAAAGGRRSRWAEGGASVGGAGIGDSSLVGLAGGGCSPGCLLRGVSVWRRSELL